MPVQDYTVVKRNIAQDERRNRRSLDQASRKIDDGRALVDRVKGNFDSHKNQLQQAKRSYENALRDYKKDVDKIIGKQREQAQARAANDSRKVNDLERQIVALDGQISGKVQRMSAAAQEIQSMDQWATRARNGLNRMAQ